MQEKVEYLFDQKTQKENKLPLSLLSLLLQILCDINITIWIFTINLVLIINFNFCSFCLIVTFTTFSNTA